MAKYIIDIPEDRIGDFVGSTCLLMPYTMAGHKGVHNTNLKLTPYNEPSQKAIDLQHAHDIENVARMNYSKGAEDAWDFARAINDMLYDDFISCYDGKTEEAVYKLSYHEAKSKYEAWKKSKDEIRVGDAVKITEGGSLCVVSQIVGGTADLIFEDGGLGQFPVDKLIRTGRHFPQVDELLKKMGEVGKWVN